MQLMFYYTLIMKTSCYTLCTPFDNLPDEVLKEIVFLISLLPYFTKRLVNSIDGLPALYFYGVQGAGKSSMFNGCKYIKKIPTDAIGVSRYRMDKMHTTLLLDDIPCDLIYQRENSSTLKQMTLGNEVEVKIMGNTQSVQAFIIVTSNEAPAFLNTDAIDYPYTAKIIECDVNDKIINDSWKRRFITCKFSIP